MKYLKAEDAVAFTSVSTVDLNPLKSFQNKICSKSVVVKKCDSKSRGDVDRREDLCQCH